MRAHAHALASLPLVAGLITYTGSPAQALAAAAVSVLIDVDHVPDYIWMRGGWRGVRDFFHSFHTQQVTRTTVILHSWELAPLAAIGLHLAGWPSWGLSLALGWAWHMLWDQLTNPVRRPFYFFLWRARNGFRLLRQPPLLRGGAKSP